MHTLQLTQEELDVIRTSLEYAKQRIAEIQETPAEVRNENMKRVESVLRKLPRTVSSIED